jgi:hypothetical protein
MNTEIMQKCGFEKEMDLVKDGLCPFCSTPIDITKFTDDCSLAEFRISGLCQKCQDKMFG